VEILPRSEQRIAFATLVALRAGLPDRERSAESSWVFVPQTAVVSTDLAIESLVQLPKPVACDAHTDAESIVVDCRAITNPGARKVHDRNAERTIRLFSHAIQRLGDTRRSDPRVLVRGYGGAVVLSLSEVQTWLRDYFVRSFAMALQRPDSDALSQGVSAILALDRAEFRMVDDSL